SNYYTNAHLLGMTLNADTTIYDKKFINKYEQTVLTGELNSSLLANGSNILKIHNYSVSGNYINSCAYDWSEMEYPRYIKAVNDSLIFSFPYLEQSVVYKFAVDNFNSPEFSFWKFNLASKVYVKYNAVLAEGKVGIADSISANDKFIIMRNPGIRKPKIYYAKKMKNLRASSNGAEYIAITHTKFKNMAEQYASFISESYSLTAATILTDDIYDEFSYGYFDPEAIKDFLMAAYSNWNPVKPEYVCLIGSATYDYYGYKNTVHVYNYVPSYGAPVSDNWFVIWDTTGASYPQMKIGRLPVISEEELNRYFEKHRKYLTRAYTDWNKKYILFSGGGAQTCPMNWRYSKALTIL
ncbi:MAG TPA: C25 family cysteine peptidase, partial [Ignavibacteriales bacterium]|nr:C25 family cysteine peptidase [Ignavibacteriales bacterium]